MQSPTLRCDTPIAQLGGLLKHAVQFGPPAKDLKLSMIVLVLSKCWGAQPSPTDASTVRITTATVTVTGDWQPVVVLPCNSLYAICMATHCVLHDVACGMRYIVAQHWPVRMTVLKNSFNASQKHHESKYHTMYTLCSAHQQ